jgi:ribonuclease P protein component
LKINSISKKERIKSKELYNLVFSNGLTMTSKNKILRGHVVFLNNLDRPTVKVGIALSKQSGIAVWRNRIKRLIKESFRLNKLELLSLCKERKKTLLVVFTGKLINQKLYKKVSLDLIMPEVKDIIYKINCVL